MTTTIRAAEAPRFQLPGREFTGLASPSRGSDGLCTWRLAVDAGFTSPDAHTVDRDEVFMVVRGRVRVADRGEELGPGDVAVVPAGSPISVSNPGTEGAEVLVAIVADFKATTADGTVVGPPPWAV